MKKYKYSTKLTELDELRSYFDDVRAVGGKTVFTNGCFDVIHAGHVRYLRSSRMLGDCLVVAVNSDNSIKQLKGADRPINTLRDRVAVLEAFDFVDRIICFDDSTPQHLLELFKPDIYTKGSDYTEENAVGGGLGRAFIESFGGQLVLISREVESSSSKLIDRLTIKSKFQ